MMISHSRVLSSVLIEIIDSTIKTWSIGQLKSLFLLYRDYYDTLWSLNVTFNTVFLSGVFLWALLILYQFNNCQSWFVDEHVEAEHTQTRLSPAT